MIEVIKADDDDTFFIPPPAKRRRAWKKADNHSKFPDVGFNAKKQLDDIHSSFVNLSPYELFRLYADDDFFIHLEKMK